HLASFLFYHSHSTTEIYTLSLHDALPILCRLRPDPDRHRTSVIEPVAARSLKLLNFLVSRGLDGRVAILDFRSGQSGAAPKRLRSEEHTSELQSPCNLVCRLLLEKKKIYHFMLTAAVCPLPHLSYPLQLALTTLPPPPLAIHSIFVHSLPPTRSL